jgi:serine O-acetyltransferase
MFANLKYDYQRFSRATDRKSAPARLLFTLLELAFFAVLVYRFGRFANKVKIPFVSPLLKIIYILLKLLSEIMTGIQISVNSDIAPGFYIGHFSCVIVTAKKIGKNCSIGQGVTIGSKGAGKSDGWPTLGNNVYIGAGAKVIGHINIGDNVVIGANAVVTKDVPDNCTAVGIPAKIMASK